MGADPRSPSAPEQRAENKPQQWLSQADNFSTSRRVTHQVWVTGALARGPSRSDSLPLGRAAETCSCPLNSHGWKPVGCAGQGRERPQRMPSLLLFSEAEHGDSLAGSGNIGVDIRAIKGQ